MTPSRIGLARSRLIGMSGTDSDPVTGAIVPPSFFANSTHGNSQTIPATPRIRNIARQP